MTTPISFELFTGGDSTHRLGAPQRSCWCIGRDCQLPQTGRGDFLDAGKLLRVAGPPFGSLIAGGLRPSDLAQRQLVDWGHILNKAMFDP